MTFKVHFSKPEMYQINKIQSPYNWNKNGILEVISRKIWMTEKSWNFHTVSTNYVPKINNILRQIVIQLFKDFIVTFSFRWGHDELVASKKIFCPLAKAK